MDPHKKSIIKTISWRVLASTDTLIIGWVITGSFAIGASIMSVEIITKLILYYFHERAWAKYGHLKHVEKEV